MALAPAANDTIVNGWVSDSSNSRGTFSIVSSCVLTLSLCVYTAIHLNVESRAQQKIIYRTWLHTTQWIILGVLAPELLCFIAWRQWISARSVSQTVKQKSSQPQLQWSAAHSYYAGMGGFVVDFDDEYLRSNPMFTTKVDRLTLTPRGVRLLIECGHMPSISREEILDKSKSDSVAKLLSALQAGWFAIQMIGRHRAGLQITILELNTITHVLCAIFIYALWWQKPKGILEPTKLQGSWLGPILAFMFMNSRISGWRSRKPGILIKTWNEPEFSILAIRSSSMTDSDEGENTLLHLRKHVTQHAVSNSPDIQSEPTISISLRPTDDVIESDDDKKAALSWLDSQVESVAGFQKERWSLAVRAIGSFSSIQDHLRVASKQMTTQTAEDVGDRFSSSDYMTTDCQQYVTDTMSNWPDDSLLREGISGVAVGAVLWLLSMLYGGLNAIAWLDYFPSNTEQYLWKISCCWIAGCGAIWVTINLTAQLSNKFYSFWESVERLKAPRIIIMILGSIATVCGTGYILARAFLVVEAFISLRSMPQDVFYTPDWVQVIPHL